MSGIDQLLEQMVRRIGNLENQVAKLSASQSAAQWQTVSSLANNGTYDLTNGANFSGLFIVNDIASGAIAVFIQGGGSVALVSQTSIGYFSVTKDTASKTNVYCDASNHIQIQNKRGSAVTYNVMMLRTRNSA
jgi:hypothetical protein